MNKRNIANSIVSAISFILAIVIHGTITVTTDLLFHGFKLYMEFIIIVLISIFIYYNIEAIKIKKKRLILLKKSSFFLLIGMFVFFIFLTHEFVAHSKDCGFYIKGNNYTNNALEYKIENNINDEDLVESVSCLTSKVWYDTEKYNKLYKYTLIITIIMMYLNIIFIKKEKKIL